MPESNSEKVSFEIGISLPPDAYQRVIDADWESHVLMLAIELAVRKRAEKPVFRDGNNFDTSEVEWFADNLEFLFLDDVAIQFLPARVRKAIAPQYQ